jgi:hypothetical protein
MLPDAPLTIELDLGHGYRALLCHGSPRANTDMIVATTSRDLLEPMLTGDDARLVVSGHTHRQLFRRHGRMTLVNTGSVGLPLDADDPAAGDGVASWAEYCYQRHGQRLRGVPAARRSTYRTSDRRRFGLSDAACARVAAPPRAATDAATNKRTDRSEREISR